MDWWFLIGAALILLLFIGGGVMAGLRSPDASGWRGECNCSECAAREGIRDAMFVLCLLVAVALGVIIVVLIAFWPLVAAWFFGLGRRKVNPQPHAQPNRKQPIQDSRPLICPPPRKIPTSPVASFRPHYEFIETHLHPRQIRIAFDPAHHAASLVFSIRSLSSTRRSSAAKKWSRKSRQADSTD